MDAARVNPSSKNPEPFSFASRPPVRGDLPYTAKEYEELPAGDKTPAMDFLILGKIPHADDSKYMLERRKPWQLIANECIKRGEIEALEFFWKASGIDPDKVTLHMGIPNLDAKLMRSVAEQCSAHPGLQLALTVGGIDPQAARELSGLIAKGNVRALYLDGRQGKIGPDSLACLLPVLGQITHGLDLNTLNLDFGSEAALAESLTNSPSLKRLNLESITFAEGNGKLFVDCLKNNHTIVELTVSIANTLGFQPAELTEILARDTKLEKFAICFEYGPESVGELDAAINAVFTGMQKNGTIQSLEVANLCYETPAKRMLANPSSLNRLLQTNAVLTRLHLNLLLASPADYQSMAESLKRNGSISEFFIEDMDKQDAGLIKSVKDTLDRNRALASFAMMRIAGMAFDPDGTSGMADPGSQIARHVLVNSSTAAEVADTLAAVELSMRELRKQEAAARPPVISSGNVTLTTDSPPPGVTTTTTSTTSTNPPAPASS